MATILTDLPRSLIVLALVAVAAVAYWRGVATARGAGLGGSFGRLRVATFAAGLVVLLGALSGPVEDAGARWLIAVAAQQQALTLVAAPLLLLGSPLRAFAFALPAALRRRALGGDGASNGLGRLSSALLGPVPAMVLFFAATSIWYAPPIFEAVLPSSALRALAQLVLFVSATLFWSQVVPSWPRRPRLGYAMRVLYIAAAGMYSSLMGAFFMFAVSPFYTHYVALVRPVGAASALVDQHLAGAAFDIPGTGVFFLAISALIYLWLREDEREGAALSAGAVGAQR